MQIHPCRHRRSNSDKSGNRSHNTCFLWSFNGRGHKFVLIYRLATSFCADGSAVPDWQLVKMRKINSCSTMRGLTVDFRIAPTFNLILA
jgi:hypothetical protein